MIGREIVAHRVARGAVAGTIAALASAALGALVALPDRAEAAGAAYQVDTAEISEPGSCKVESWYSSAANHDLLAAISPACVFDFGRRTELSVQVNRSRTDGEWGTAATPKAKVNLIPSAIGSFGVALSGQAGFDLLSGEMTSFAATLPATLRMSEVVRINLNAGWMWDRLADRHFGTYGAGIDVRTPDNVWTVTAEVFGQFGPADAETPYTVRPRAQLGLRWRPVDHFNVDLIYGHNLGGENSNWITLATVIRFPVPTR